MKEMDVFDNKYSTRRVAFYLIFNIGKNSITVGSYMLNGWQDKVYINSSHTSHK